MKFHRTRRTLAESKCEIEMTPTLDIIFQMLIFFILTFRPIADEGQFGINLSSVPAGTSASPSAVPGMEEITPPDIQFNPPFRVQLVAAADGSIAEGGIVLGEDRRLPSLDHLRRELRTTVQGFAEDFEVIIEADAALHYQYIVQAVNAVSHTGIRKISFAVLPAGAGS